MKATFLTLLQGSLLRRPLQMLQSHPSVQHAPDAAPRKSRIVSRRAVGWGLGAILIFAVSYLQLGLVKFYHAPAEERVNDGLKPTFFAFYVSPHGVASEDFHLYWVRSQRILNRGWRDSLFSQRLETGHSNFVAPLQTLLGMVALATQGKPVPYSIFMACVFALGWGTLFLVARRFFPARYSTATIVLAVMVAVLFESLQYFFVVPELGGDFPWPLHRHMRISTLAWTTPLLLSSIIAAVSLWYSVRKKWRTIGIVISLLLVLACTDNWAFALGLLATGFVWGGLAVRWVVVRWTGRTTDFSGAPLLVLGFLLAAVFTLNSVLAGPISGDALSRAGFGPTWSGTRRDPGVFFDILINWLLPWGAINLGMIAALAAWLSIQVHKLGSFVWLVRLRLTALQHWRPVTIAVIATAATISLLVATWWKGLEPYVRNQCYWRIDVVLLFSLVLLLADALRMAMGIAAKYWPRLARMGGPVTLLLLGSLLAYHQYRIHWFRANVVGKEYFLTRDAEKLRSWLKEFDGTHKRFSLATLSPELNYLSAYWTNADLLLPSGFPYHTLADNLRIRHRTVELLRLYNVSSEAWNSFVEPRPVYFFDQWRVSRAEAAGLSFIYYLYHRAFSLDSKTQPSWRRRETNTIARRLAEPPSRGVPKPDVIIVDEVSRAVGEPDLRGYKREFKSDTIEAWVRRKFVIADRVSTRAAKRH